MTYYFSASTVKVTNHTATAAVWAGGVLQPKQKHIRPGLS